VLREVVRRLLADELRVLPADAAPLGGGGPGAQLARPPARYLLGRAAAAAQAAAARAAPAALDGSGAVGARGDPEERGARDLAPGCDGGAARPAETATAAASDAWSDLEGARLVRPAGGPWRGGSNPGRIVVSRAELQRWLARRTAHDAGA
jgi:hypothetical protein